MDFYDDYDVEDAGLREIERRSDLERTRANGAAVEIDAAENTSLRRYMTARRTAALEALASLASVDPKDAIEVMRHQAIVHGYLTVREWVRSEVEASKQAHEQLTRGDDYGEDD